MLKKNSKIELEQFLLETDTPPQGVSLAKRLLLAGILIGISASAVAEESPHWIGLDTTIRDSQTWTAPVESTFLRSLDTRVSDFWASVGTVIRGMFIKIK